MCVGITIADPCLSKAMYHHLVAANLVLCNDLRTPDGVLKVTRLGLF